MEMYRNILAKPDKSLLAHSIDTGLVCKVLMSKNGAFYCGTKLISEYTKIEETELINFISYIASLHDIGKAHPTMQRNLNENSLFYKYIDKNGYTSSYDSDTFRHEMYSKYLIETVLANKINVDRETLKLVKTVVQLHHQKKAELMIYYKFFEDDCIDESCKTFWKTCIENTEKDLRNVFDPQQIKVCDYGHVDAIGNIIVGFIIVSDWIASEYLTGDIDVSIDNYVNKTEHKIKDIISDIGLFYHETKHDYKSFKAAWGFEEKDLRPIQKVTEDIFNKTADALLTIIEAPMGDGKTEAGIYAAEKICAAYGKTGFYMALPTNATSNQMCTRINKYLDKNDITAKLMHSDSWLENPTSINGEATKWYNSNRRGLLAQYAVGTVDQVMMAAMLVKFSVLRLIGLSNKVLIIDEVHSYDTYMSTVIECLLKWCKELEIPVVLLSATLTDNKRDSFIHLYTDEKGCENGYPIITTVSKNGAITQKTCACSYPAKTIMFDTLPILNDIEKIANFAIDRVSNGGNLLVRVNTVKKAQQVYEKIKEKNTNVPIYIFHARYCNGKRAQITDTIMKTFGKGSLIRPKTSITIATQVIEQSLDVDFDMVATDISPIDTMLQTIGRWRRHAENDCNRNGMDNSINVFIPKEAGDYRENEAIYAPLLLNGSLSYIQNHASFVMPNDIKHAINTVYDINKNEEDCLKEYIENMSKSMISKDAAIQYERKNPNDKSMRMENFTLKDDDMVVPTRLASIPTYRFALVSKDLFDKVKKCTNDIPATIAKEVYEFVVSIPATKHLKMENAEEFERNDKHFLIGKGLLHNVFIAEINEDAKYTAYNNKFEIEMNKELGIIAK